MCMTISIVNQDKGLIDLELERVCARANTGFTSLNFDELTKSCMARLHYRAADLLDFFIIFCYDIAFSLIHSSDL